MKETVILAETILLLLFLSLPSAAATEPGEGYDENTEVTIRGMVKSLETGRRGPVIFTMVHHYRPYHVVTAPRWYLRQENIDLRPGLGVEVTGSKVFGDDGVIYLISRKVKILGTGREFLLRDSSLRPLWHGMREHMRNR